MFRFMSARPVLGLCKSQILTNSASAAKQDISRFIGNETRARSGAFGRRMGVNTRTTLKEKLNAPTTVLPFAIGQGVVLGASALGLGALCYYGAGLANEAGAFERSIGWDDIVKERIRSTYMYFGGGIAASAASAAIVFRTPALLNLAARNSIMAMVASLVVMVGTGMLCRSIPYTEGFGAKQASWLLHAASVGGIIAPMALLGGPILLRAAFYTAGIVGGLSTVAACAPSEKFLTWGAPLSIGLGVVFASSLAGMFLPPTTALGAGLYSLSLYGGLVLFSAFLLYDTQKIIKRCETHPMYGAQPYDPVNASLSIYMDTINIFIRMVAILQGGSKKR